MEIRGTTAIVVKVGTLIETYEKVPPRKHSHFAITHIDTGIVVHRAIVSKVEQYGDYYKVTSVVYWVNEDAIEEDDPFSWLNSLNNHVIDIQETNIVDILPHLLDPNNKYPETTETDD